MNERTRRILSGVLGGAIYIALGLLGGLWLPAGLGVVLLLGLREYWLLCRSKGIWFQLEVPAAVGLLLLLAVALVTCRAPSPIRMHAGETCVALAAAILVTATGLAAVLRNEIRDAAAAASLCVLGGVYISFPLAYMIMLRNLPGTNGRYYFFLLTLVVWAGDSAAYFAGTAWGRHRLAPRISPGKSIEGTVAGLAASAAGGVIYALAWGRSPWRALGLGLLTGTAGQVGDLFESLLKRDFGIKDSGRFLPGHGGVLDRFDSLFFAAPFLYYLVAYLT